MSSKYIPRAAQETEQLKQIYRQIRKQREQAKINEAFNDTLPEGSIEPCKPEATTTFDTGDNSGLPLVGEEQGNPCLHDGGNLPG